MNSEHDWFKIDLPEYLFPSASDVDASVVDTDAIREVCEVRWHLQPFIAFTLLAGFCTQLDAGGGMSTLL